MTYCWTDASIRIEIPRNVMTLLDDAIIRGGISKIVMPCCWTDAATENFYDIFLDVQAWSIGTLKQETKLGIILWSYIAVSSVAKSTLKY